MLYNRLTRLYPLILIATITACHRPATDAADRQAIAEVLMHSEFTQNLRALSMPGGRLSGTDNATRAEEYVAEQLRAYGLQNVHFEPFDMECWTVHETVVTLLDEPRRVLEGAVGLGRTMSTPAAGVTAETIFLNQGSVEDFETHADEIPGKFVVVHDGGDSRSDKTARAVAHDAAGVVIISREGRNPIIGNGHTEARPEPVVVIPRDEDVLQRIAAGNSLRLNIKLVTDNWSCTPRNVIGEIPGHGPTADEVVLLTAHLDSWHLAEGGMDNGSGSAAILETARALAGIDWQPRRTVRFVWFMAEELGLLGSRAYVDAHHDELDRIVAVINADMPGEPRRLIVFGHPEIEPFLNDVQADLAAYELDTHLSESTRMWSDHGPFLRQGVCTLALGGELGPGVEHYHTTGDTFETVDRRGTVQSAAVFAVLLRRLADADPRPTVRNAPISEP